MQRQEWLNLNGTWRFKADPERKGLKERWYLGSFNDTITVPFPIESEASGIHNLSPEKTYWYATEFNLPVSWQNKSYYTSGVRLSNAGVYKRNTGL